MFSEDPGVSHSACEVLEHLSQIVPDLVAPLVIRRFSTSLVTITSAHQLEPSLAALTRCLRPLLAAGCPPDAGRGQSVSEGGGPKSTGLEDADDLVAAATGVHT